MGILEYRLRLAALSCRPQEGRGCQPWSSVPPPGPIPPFKSGFPLPPWPLCCAPVLSSCDCFCRFLQLCNKGQVHEQSVKTELPFPDLLCCLSVRVVGDLDSWRGLFTARYEAPAEVPPPRTPALTLPSGSAQRDHPKTHSF